MKRIYFSVLVVLLSFFLAGSFVAASAAEKKTVWKFQSAFPETDCDWYVTLKRLKALIEEASKGQIEVKVFPAGVLCDPDSIVDAVTNGAIQGGHIIAGMAADRVPSCLGTEMPYGARDIYEHFEVHFLWGLLDIMREEYAKRNLHLLTVGTSGQVTFQSTFPVHKVDDLKGKKMWAIPNAVWLSKLGASTVEVPGLDMYSALKLGTIDGFTWTVGELEYGNFKEVVKYVMQPRLLTPGTHIIVNKKAWEKLGAELQARIQDHIFAHQFEITKEYNTFDDKALAAARDYGVKFIELSQTELARFKATAQEFWNEVEGMSPSAKMMIKRYREFLSYKGIE